MGIEAFGLRPSHPLCYAMLCYSRNYENSISKTFATRVVSTKVLRYFGIEIHRGIVSIAQHYCEVYWYSVLLGE